MAKAKKPTSGNKGTSGAPKAVSAKAKNAASEVTPDAVPKPDAKANSKPAVTAKTTSATTSSSVPKPAKTEPMKSPEPVGKPDTPVAKDNKPASAASKVAETTKVSKDSITPADVKPEVSKPATTVPPSTPASPAEPQKSRGSIFWPLLFGGMIAGGIGFVVSEMDLLNRSANTSKIEQTLSTQADRIATLEAVEPAAAEVLGLDELKASVATMEEALTAFEARLSEVENRPVSTGDGSGPSPEYAEGLAALQSSVEEQKAEISRLLENALSVEEATANVARAAAIQGALTTITTALGSGAGFAPAVEELKVNGIEDVPVALTENVDGVVTLLSLQTSFPVAARAALSSARAAGEDEGAGGVGAFFKRQLGARSVAPREGSDPDAVLSRAEAAVRQGDVAEALTEVDALPAPAKDAMADWLVSARARAAAEAAVQDLSQRLSAN